MFIAHKPRRALCALFHSLCPPELFLVSINCIPLSQTFARSILITFSLCLAHSSQPSPTTISVLLLYPFFSSPSIYLSMPFAAFLQLLSFPSPLSKSTFAPKTCRLQNSRKPAFTPRTTSPRALIQPFPVQILIAEEDITRQIFLGAIGIVIASFVSVFIVGWAINRNFEAVSIQNTTFSYPQSYLLTPDSLPFLIV